MANHQRRQRGYHTIFLLVGLGTVGVLATGVYFWPKPAGATPCLIAPPKDYHGDRAAAAKLAVDLAAITKKQNPMSADLQLKNTVAQTFQTVPEPQIACQMLLQTVACLAATPGNDRNVNTLLTMIHSDNRCGAPKSSYTDLIDTLKSLLMLESGQAPVHFLLDIQCRTTDKTLRVDDQLRRKAQMVLEDLNRAERTAAGQSSPEFIISEFGTYRQLMLDLARRRDILNLLAKPEPLPAGTTFCTLAKEYKELHFRLAHIESRYYNYLQQREKWNSQATAAQR